MLTPGQQGSSTATDDLYVKMVNSLNGIVWEADGLTFQFTFVSPQAERILGYPASQWIDQPDFWQAHTHPDDVGWCTAFCLDSTRHRRDHQFEYRMIAADGRVVWLRDSVTVKAEPDGSVRLWGVMLDISDRKADEELLNEQLRFETLVSELSSTFTHIAAGDVAPTIDAWLERIGTHLGVDRATLLEFGDDHRTLERRHLWTAPGVAPLWPAEIHDEFRWITNELRQGRVVRIAHSPDDWPPEAAQERAFSDTVGVQSALNIPIRVGNHVICALALTSIRARREWSDALINRLRLVGEIFANALQRQRVTQERDQLLSRLRSIVAASAQIVWVGDAEGRAADVADWCSVTGQQDTEARGWGWMDAVHPDDRERVNAAVAAGLDARRPFALEGRVRVRDGSYRQFACRWVPVIDDEHRVREWVGTCADVTEHRHLQEQLMQSQKMDAIGQLAGGVAHDFNNLLTVINGYGQILADSRELSGDNAELVAEMRRAGEHAAVLTRRLLAFSRKQVLAPRLLDLNGTVRDLERMLRRLIGEDVELATFLAPDLRPVMADAGQLEQVLMNLCINARDAMPRGGRLMIRTTNADLDKIFMQAHHDMPPGRYVQLTVEDTGSGMSEDVKRHVFEPFFTTKAPGHGTGLGLATVYGIVRQSGGQIDVFSELDIGSTFRVLLPAAEGTVADPAAASAKARPAPGRGAILLVEDEDAVRALTRRVLERNGYTVLEARNGSEALRLADEATSGIDLLITDVVMPEMGGGELARKLEAQRPGLKVLYLSGYTDDAIIRHGILGHEVSFLQKPFGIEAFLTKVHEVLERPG